MWCVYICQYIHILYEGRMSVSRPPHVNEAQRYIDFFFSYYMYTYGVYTHIRIHYILYDNIWVSLEQHVSSMSKNVYTYM